MFFRLILLFQITVFLLLCSCGSGTVVGNPEISGRVLSPDGKPVSSCKVTLGPTKEDPGKPKLIPGVNELIIVLQSKPFKPIYTDTNGFFKFDTVEQGTYCILAEKDHLMGIFETIDHFGANKSDVGDIEINFPSKLTINNYSSAMDTSEKRFITARIDGTELTPRKDIKDRIYFSEIPEGIYDIILYRENDSVEYIKGLNVKSKDSITIQVNPATKPEEWTYRQSGGIKRPRPYVYKYGFEAAPISDSYNLFRHYCWIQFSHDMETRITGEAVKAFSSDSLTKINKIQWQGSNQLLIDLCTNGTAVCTDDTTGLKKGITYSIVIDTTARSIDGYTLAWPDTLKLTP